MEWKRRFVSAGLSALIVGGGLWAVSPNQGITRAHAAPVAAAVRLPAGALAAQQTMAAVQATLRTAAHRLVFVGPAQAVAAAGAFPTQRVVSMAGPAGKPLARTAKGPSSAVAAQAATPTPAPEPAGAETDTLQQGDQTAADTAPEPAGSTEAADGAGATEPDTGADVQQEGNFEGNY